MARPSSEVGSAVLTAVATTVISFLPVFTMEAAEGKLSTQMQDLDERETRDDEVAESIKHFRSALQAASEVFSDEPADPVRTA